MSFYNKDNADNIESIKTSPKNPVENKIADLIIVVKSLLVFDKCCT